MVLTCIIEIKYIHNHRYFSDWKHLLLSPMCISSLTTRSLWSYPDLPAQSDKLPGKITVIPQSNPDDLATRTPKFEFLVIKQR